MYGAAVRWESANSPFVLPMAGIPSDIDDQGIASNISVVAWLVRAAIAHSTAMGYDRQAYYRMGTMFVVRRHEIDYLRSARLGDELLLRTWPSFMKAATAHRKHEVVRRDNGQVIARGLNVWAHVDRLTGKPVRMDEDLLRAFEPSQFL